MREIDGYVGQFSIVRARGRQAVDANDMLRGMGIVTKPSMVRKDGQVVGFRLDGACSPGQFPAILAGEIIYNTKGHTKV